MHQWDERYNVDEYFYGTKPNDFLKASADSIAPKSKILCLAEGEGRNAVYLAILGHDVTAVDGSKVGLEKLKRLADKNQVVVNSIVSDLNDFIIAPNAWDAIVAIWCHLPEPLRLKIYRASVCGLKSHGVFIAESYHPDQLKYKTGGPPTADLMLTKEIVQKELIGLQFEILRETERDIHEGMGHNGRSAVVQVLARKGE